MPTDRTRLCCGLIGIAPAVACRALHGGRCPRRVARTGVAPVADCMALTCPVPATRCLVHVCRWLAQTLLGPRGPIDMDRDFAESYPREKRADLRKELDYFAQVRRRWLAIPFPARRSASPQPLFLESVPFSLESAAVVVR